MDSEVPDQNERLHKVIGKFALFVFIATVNNRSVMS